MCLTFLSERNVFFVFPLGFIDCELLSLNHTPQQWKLFHSNYAESNCKTPMPFSLEVPHVLYKRFFSNWTFAAGEISTRQLPEAGQQPLQEKVLSFSQVFHCRCLSGE